MARDEGFRKTFEGSGFDLPETQFCEGDAIMALINDGCLPATMAQNPV